MKRHEIRERFDLGGPGSGNRGHTGGAGGPGNPGGSSAKGASVGALDLSDWRASVAHKQKTLDNLTDLKGKFTNMSYTDTEGITYTVKPRMRHWVTGKYVAGTQEQQRYAIEAVLRAKDSNGKGWNEIIAKTATRKHGTYDLLHQKDIPSMSRKLKNMLGITDKLYV